MLQSDFKSQILAMHFGYSIIFNEHGTEYTGFDISVTRGLIPRPLPVKLPFDNYNRPKLEQFMLIRSSQNNLTALEMATVSTSPATDLELVFELNDGAKFVPITMNIDDDKQSIIFYS